MQVRTSLYKVRQVEGAYYSHHTDNDSSEAKASPVIMLKLPVMTSLRPVDLINLGLRSPASRIFKGPTCRISGVIQAPLSSRAEAKETSAFYEFVGVAA